MAENLANRDAERIEEIRKLLWGETAKQDVFQRWAQGEKIKENFHSRRKMRKKNSIIFAFSQVFILALTSRQLWCKPKAVRAL